jgi:hypothetical protein
MRYITGGSMNAILAELQAMPSLGVYAVFMASTALTAALGCVLLAPLVRPPQTKEHLDVAMRTTGAVMAALTLILAFCAVQARSQSDDARRAISTEVAAISTLARISHRIGVPGSELRSGIIAYVHAVIDREFPNMVAQGAEAETSRLALAIEEVAYLAAGALPEAMATDILQETEEVEAARERRLHAARSGLPFEFWLLIALLFALLVLTGALYPPRRHTVGMLAVQAAGGGALVAFVFIVAQPFRDGTGLTSEPYQALLHRIEHQAELHRHGPYFARP